MTYKIVQFSLTVNDP